MEKKEEEGNLRQKSRGVGDLVERRLESWLSRKRGAENGDQNFGSLFAKTE